MYKGKAKKILIMICFILILGPFFSNMSVQAQETNLITGKMYAMYFLTVSLNNNAKGLSQIDFMFNEDGSVSGMDMKGHGLYFAIPGAFASTYYADGLVMNFKMMDIFIAMTGITLDRFITGVGFFLIDYVEFAPFVFTGLELTE